MTCERTNDWVDDVVAGLVRRAARRAPAALSERLQEEWLADLAEQRGRWARLRFGIGCCWAINVIIREQLAAGLLPAPVSAAADGHTVRLHQDDFPFFTGRTITFVLIVALHGAVLYGLAMGLGQKFTKLVAVPFVTRVIDRPPSQVLPPVPRPKLSTTRIELPPQTFLPPIEADPQQIIAATPHEPPRESRPPSTPLAIDRVQGGPGPGFPSTADFYPAASIRLGERGIATVRACVDGKGRLLSEPTLLQSTGSARLDASAIKLAKAGTGRYRATTENGVPVSACYPFRIRFELRN